LLKVRGKLSKIQSSFCFHFPSAIHFHLLCKDVPREK